MRQLYPPLEPTRHGMLDVGDGQQVYWEECGSPDGKPVVFLHGGPGGGCNPDSRRLFDPARYRIVLFDQRGCGRSLPHAGDHATDLTANTTWHLVADMERLREHLSIDAWQIFGGSWGSTLALAYAQTHPERVTELVLRGIFTVRESEVDWLYEGGAENILPDAWEEYVAPVPADERRPGGYVDAFSRLLADPDPAVHGTAALAWARWEASTIRLLPHPEVVERFSDPDFSLAVARIENHYFTHAGWLEEGQLLRDAERIAHIPTVIVQGRYDVCTPPVTAWDLHRALPDAVFRMVDGAGHSADEPGIRDALLEATDGFAGR
ncbi:proline iminopeptidase [Frondihabitans sp. PAMC 28766]|uniref:prolyl aminopeptidase n=1 Tax=Frondihabitans sp. PAMC 28766 TaxID=1795630 RepID=UPI00078BAD31|nr:prolyl aminopeptidase [Frondihabitans sp. PAMC 28766]AMM21501.1 proline iminopeptidase [Frondihabitans sp. PAMC 28766]